MMMMMMLLLLFISFHSPSRLPSVPLGLYLFYLFNCFTPVVVTWDQRELNIAAKGGQGTAWLGSQPIASDAVPPARRVEMSSSFFGH